MSHNLEVITDQLHAAGYRMTPQRQLILDAVCMLGGHVTPDAVYEQVQTITHALNRSTVYRTLQFLSERRILTLILLPDSRVGYELMGKMPHQHLVCRVCHKVEQIQDRTFQKVAAHMAADYQFQIDLDHITLTGVCAGCQQQHNPN